MSNSLFRHLNLLLQYVRIGGVLVAFWIAFLYREVIHLSPILRSALDPGYGSLRIGSGGIFPPPSIAPVVPEAIWSQPTLICASLDILVSLLVECGPIALLGAGTLPGRHLVGLVLDLFQGKAH